jgi:uncharacterized protein
MKMALDDTAGMNIIRGYEPGRVRIHDQVHHNSLIVLPDHLLTGWEPARVGDLRAASFNALLELSPEVVLLGTGESQVFPEPVIFTLLMDIGVGFEVMDNAAACRTYNILIGEDRRAALALLLPGE